MSGEIPLAAEALGVGTSTRYRKLREYGVLVRQNRKTGEKYLTTKSTAAARLLRAVKGKTLKDHLRENKVWEEMGVSKVCYPSKSLSLFSRAQEVTTSSARALA